MKKVRRIPAIKIKDEEVVFSPELSGLKELNYGCYRKVKLSAPY